MSVTTEVFPKLYPKTFVEEASPQVAGIFGSAARAATGPAVRASDNLYRRNSQTGAPEGVLAYVKERIIAMLFLRRRKIHSRPYRRMPQSRVHFTPIYK